MTNEEPKQAEGIENPGLKEVAGLTPEEQERQERIEAMQEALAGDEIAQRVRALGMALFVGLSTLDKASGREEPRTEDDPLAQVMIATLDIIDLYLHDLRAGVNHLKQSAETLQRLAHSISTHEKPSSITKNVPWHLVGDSLRPVIYRDDDDLLPKTQAEIYGKNEEERAEIEAKKLASKKNNADS